MNNKSENRKQSAKYLLSQCGGYYASPRSLLGVIPNDAWILLTLFIELEDCHGPGFFYSLKQIAEKFKWDKRNITRTLKFLTESGIIHSERRDRRRNRYWIVHENLINWGLNAKEQMKQYEDKYAPIKSYGDENVPIYGDENVPTKLALSNQVSEHNTSITCKRESFSQTISQTLNFDSELYAIDDLLKDTLPKLSQA